MKIIIVLGLLLAIQFGFSQSTECADGGHFE